MVPPGPRTDPRKPRLRVAHVVRSDAFAGVERYITYVAPGLVGRGYEVTVIGGHPTQMKGILVPAGARWIPATSTSQVAMALARSRPFNLVHTHMAAAELAAVLTTPLTRSPFVTTRHFAARRGRSLGGRLAALAIGRVVRCEIAISQFVASSIEQPSVVIPNGVPRAEASRVRLPVVLMAQRLEPEKNVAVGIEAWAASELASEGWRLIIAGTGSLEQELKALARRQGVARSVDFVGRQADLAPLLDEAGIFLATARAEPFGLSVVEAMATALPVVASASGAHLETVGMCSSEWMYSVDDPSACADRLRRLAENPTERDTYGRDLQRQQRAHFDLETHIDLLSELYQRLIDTGEDARLDG